VREYTRREAVVANLPYAAMVLIGSGTIASSLDRSLWTLAGAVGYVIYGVAGALWIMVFMCPYCAYYASKGCPCGYGTIAARLVPRGERECFSEKFKRHIPVIVPLWLIPVAYGAWSLWQSFSWGLFGLVSLFAVNSYVILPLVSKKHGCSDCPQRDDCPWMTQKARSAPVSETG
jgi:hypothetical protein